MPAMRKGFCNVFLEEWKGFCNVFLEECLKHFKMCGDSKEYIYFVRYGVRNMYKNYV